MYGERVTRVATAEFGATPTQQSCNERSTRVGSERSAIARERLSREKLYESGAQIAQDSVCSERERAERYNANVRERPRE